jgi:excisionase family DNA binding protein
MTEAKKRRVRGKWRGQSTFGARLAYRPKEAAQLCGCSLDTIYDAIELGDLPTVRIPGSGRPKMVGRVERGEDYRNRKQEGGQRDPSQKAQGRAQLILHNDLCVWWNNYQDMSAVNYQDVEYPLQQVADLLGLTRYTVMEQTWDSCPDPLPYSVHPGPGKGRYMVRHRDLVDWLDRNRRVPAQPKAEVGR